MQPTLLTTADAAVRWLNAAVPTSLKADSRQVLPGDAFLAWPGEASDGRHHVAAALAAGATRCLVEAEGVEAFGFDDERIAAVPALKAATGLIASAFYRNPSQALRMAAVTGTNGKTSSAWWMAQALTLLGKRCGVVGTLGIGEPPIPGQSEGGITYTGLTTPDPVVLHAGLRRMVDHGFGACVLEASSIGLAESRLDGTRIELAVFTNFTQDHLDYHGDMAQYWAAKRVLFNWPGLKSVVINADDPQGAVLVAELAGKGKNLWTVSVRGEGRLCAHEPTVEQLGLAFTLVEGPQRVPVQTQLIGSYNVSNLLGVAGGLRAMGYGLPEIAQALGRVTPVPGRMQRITSAAPDESPGPEPEVVVDYAHTPDALEKALESLRPLARNRGGRLWCVFGCGGDRDASKRPLMGAVASRLADQVVVTSDNPRRESAVDIISHIMEGVDPALKSMTVTTEPDRRMAILDAVTSSDPRDVVLIAGKGHEDYQEIDGVKHAFSDALIASASLAARSPE